jgi:hypothetical protein
MNKEKRIFFISVSLDERTVNPIKILSGFGLQQLYHAYPFCTAKLIFLVCFVSLEKLKAMGESIGKNPLQFKYTAQEIRELNRS